MNKELKVTPYSSINKMNKNIIKTVNIFALLSELPKIRLKYKFHTQDRKSETKHLWKSRNLQQYKHFMNK